MSEQLELFPEENVKLTPPTPINDAEWCFQFFNNEPIVFAYSETGEESTPLVLTIESNESEGLTFTHNGMQFRIFPRPISEETKKVRAKENESKN